MNTFKDLYFCFDTAIRFNCKYVAVLVQMDGFPEPELIINKNENIKDKLDYYKNAYDENLNHKHANGIKIIGFSHGDSIKELLNWLPEFK